MAQSQLSEIGRAALSYAGRGWSVIPAEPRGKRPIVAWQEFERRIASADEIASLFRPRGDDPSHRGRARKQPA